MEEFERSAAERVRFEDGEPTRWNLGYIWVEDHTKCLGVWHIDFHLFACIRGVLQYRPGEASGRVEPVTPSPTWGGDVSETAGTTASNHRMAGALGASGGTTEQSLAIHIIG